MNAPKIDHFSPGTFLLNGNANSAGTGQSVMGTGSNMTGHGGMLINNSPFVGNPLPNTPPIDTA